MHVNSAYLLLLRLGDCRAPDHDPLAQASDTDIIRYAPEGHLLGSRAFTTRAVSIANESFGSVSRVLSRWPEQLPAAGMALVPLQGFSLSAYRDAGYSLVNAWRQNLIRGAFDELDAYPDRDYLSVLYLEPHEPLCTGQASRANTRAAVERIRALNEDRGVAVPQQYRDLFVCHGWGMLGENWDLIAIRYAPLEGGVEGRHCLPNSLFELAEAAALIQRLEHARKTLQAHPLLAQSPASYVANELGLSSQAPSSLRWLTDSAASSAYARHMATRLRGIGSKDSARNLADAYRRTAKVFDDNAATVNDDWVWLTDTFSDSPYGRGMVSALRGGLRAAGTAVAAAVEDLDLRDEAISSYFTDYLNAAVAQSNMLLQRRVFWLTILTVALAILSLLQPFLAR